MVCEDEIADQVLTHVGSFSLFIEIDTDSHHELEGEIHKPTCLEHGIDGVEHVLLVLRSIRRRHAATTTVKTDAIIGEN
jgi:hypothetical protein